jgi:hypothetical protein
MWGRSATEKPPADDLESRFQALIGTIDGRIGLTAVPVEPELAEPGSFLKILKARHYNWSAPRFRKVFGMRFDVRLPPLEQMNLIIYPDSTYDTPIFLMFCLLTRNKVILHVNVNCTSDHPDYRQKWVAPLLAIQARYPDFSCDDRYPDWMQKWRTPAGIYGMFPKARSDDFWACAGEYLEAYLDLAVANEPITDPARRVQVEAANAQFVSDIRTQDKAQSMMARMIGKDTARRIFWEVTT